MNYIKRVFVGVIFFSIFMFAAYLCFLYAGNLMVQSKNWEVGSYPYDMNVSTAIGMIMFGVASIIIGSVMFFVSPRNVVGVE